MSAANTLREAVVHYRNRGIGSSVAGPADLVRFLRRVVHDHAREHVVCVWFDGARVPIGWHVASSGTANSSVIHPREVFQLPLMAGAVSIALSHNHPSGRMVASEDDVRITRRLLDAGALLGIEVEDHVIWSHGCTSHVSLREQVPSLFREASR